MNLVNSIWVEKYRPAKIDDVVLNDEHKTYFKRIIERQELSNILLYGPPGGGKSTILRIICSKNGVVQNKNDNLLEINGSAKETKGIGYVSDTIEPFLKIPPAGIDKYKIVFIDEVDYLTDQAFHSLRGVIEKYNLGYGRFVFTCNYISKVPDAIQSRCTSFLFKQIPLDYVFNYCKNILKNESIEYKEDSLATIINSLYPDIRKIVNALQKCSINNKLQVDSKTITTNEKIITSMIVDIVKFVKNNETHKIGKVMNDIVEIISKDDLDYRSIYSTLFFMNGIPAPAKIVINEYTNSHQSCLVPQMHFSAMIFKIIRTLNEYGKK